MVCLPEYRPELVQVLATRLELDHFDFRALVMAPLGAGAGRLSLATLDDWLQRAVAGGGE